MLKELVIGDQVRDGRITAIVPEGNFEAWLADRDGFRLGEEVVSGRDIVGGQADPESVYVYSRKGEN